MVLKAAEMHAKHGSRRMLNSDRFQPASSDERESGPFMMYM
jgi:hypothetical protein